MIEHALKYLDRLIAFDTVSDRSNLAMIDYLEDRCRALGAETTRLPAQAPGKAGLVARLGPSRPGGLVLSGHTDVVPVEGQSWSKPPFTLTRDNDRLYGRGTTDMKGFLAAMLTTGEVISGRPLDRPLTLVFSYDEEVGCRGMAEMAPRLKDLIAPPELCLVGEPTGLRVASGHKGKFAMQADFIGQAGHSASAPRFVNAIDLAADFVSALRGLQREYEAASAPDPDFDIPFATFHVGRISGGTALNIVPDRAKVEFECRYPPATEPQQARASLAALADEIARTYRTRSPLAGIVLGDLASYPGLDPDRNREATERALKYSPHQKPIKVDYGTEAGLLSDIGFQTVVCGPGDMAAQGHKPDEFLTVSQLSGCLDLLADAAKDLCLIRA